jgi:hypothetical protein
MAENSGAEKGWGRLHEIVRNSRALWRTGGGVVLVALVGVTWLERKWVHLPSDWFLPLGLTAGALFALAILWKVPQWQVGRVRRLDTKERFDRVNEARKTLATILGGIVLLAGFFGTWQNIRVAQDAASTSQRALAVSQEGQITDRFSKAIEQLGAVDSTGRKKLEVRLGGIYALEGIANESKELHWPIMEVLCSYVRENARRKPQDANQQNRVSITPPYPDADIQAILTVLGRRDRRYELGHQRLDLRDIDIGWANLFEADLSGANLSRANLLAVNLNRADLSGANLSRATFLGVIISGMYVNVTSLSGTNLSGTNLSQTNLSGTNLSEAKGLTQEQVDTALGNSATQLPENLHMPESWQQTARPPEP